MSAIDYNVANGFVIAILQDYRAGVDAYGAVDLELRFPWEIRDALIRGDGVVAAAACADKTHWARKYFLTGSAVGVANGSQLVTRIGPPESVQFVITGGVMSGTRPGQEKPIAYVK